MTDTFYYTDRSTPNSSAVDSVFYDEKSDTIGVRYLSGPTIYAWNGTEDEFYDIIHAYSVGNAVRDFKFGRGAGAQFDDADFRLTHSVTNKVSPEPVATNNYHINLNSALDSSQNAATQVASAVNRAFGKVHVAGHEPDHNSYIVTLDVKGYRIDLEVEADDVTEAADEAILALSDSVEVVAVVRD